MDLLEQESMSIKKNHRLLATSVLVVVLRILNVSDRIHNRVFDAIRVELNEDQAASRVNKLSAIIFELIKTEPWNEDPSSLSFKQLSF